ncbi:MAG: N-acetyl-gamma-glutamyl-phosphate reductase [Fibrobacteres bacterium]|nr:N-acetyl-gamma-glutamyl-phosphate reductase [Fibrobacterota bacterium]
MPNTQIQVGILGATGFTGCELVGLLLRHPRAEIAWLSSESQPGTAYGKVYPQYLGRLPPQVEKMRSFEDVKATVPDVVFSCLPHGASAECAAPFLMNGKTIVIDLSADFRLKDPKAYAEAYAHTHPMPERLKESRYGLCEVHGGEIKGARLIANPGCYPTSAILPLYPLIRDGVVSPDGIIIDAKSGVSGAGKKPTETTHYVMANESVTAYGVGDKHRHRWEIIEQLSLAAGRKLDLLFTAHLIPMERGILSTIYCDLADGKTAALAEACLRKQYEGSDFVRIREDFPRTGDVKHSNFCHMKVYQPAGGRKLIIVSVIDNMVKGASGQALQNMNIALGLPETLGLA